jgi:hypothetical protein
MIFIIDNVSALLVFASVAFVITMTQFRAQQATVEQTIAYMSKKQTLEFADMLEQELKLVGAGRDEGEDMIESIVPDAYGNTGSFTFWRAEPLGPDLEIVYTLAVADSVQVEGDWVRRFQLTRTENGTAAGGSPATLRSFNLQLLDSGGGAASVADAELIRVSFINMYPVGNPDDMAIRQTHWGITVRPLNLAGG